MNRFFLKKNNLVRNCQYLFLIIPFFFLSCGSSDLNLEYQSPTLRFQSPETTGKSFGARAQVSVGSAYEVSLARSRQTKSFFSSTPHAVTIEQGTQITPEWNIGYGANLGLLSRLDFYILNRGDATLSGGLQLQIFGGDAKKTGFKVSVTVGGGYSNEEELSSEGLLESEDSFDNVTGKIVNKSWDTSIIIGRRINDKLLLYVNINYTEDDISSHIQVEGQSRIYLDNRFEKWGGLMGIIFESHLSAATLFFQAEGGLSNFKSRFGQSASYDIWGLGLGLRF